MMLNPMNSKSAASFVPEDFLTTPVWEYVPATALGADQDESWMVPVPAFPVTELDDRAVGVEVKLADGTSAFAVVFATCMDTPEINALTQSFVFLHNGARCSWKPTGGAGTAGASQVADFLGKSQKQVFPFMFDLTPYAIGTAEILRRSVAAASPDERDPWEIALELADHSIGQGR